MKNLIKALFLVMFAVGLSACAKQIPIYNGPEVTSIVVYKGERRLHVMHDTLALRSYDIELGFQPEGDKVKEGDGRTPEGAYRISWHNPNSQYHLSLGISYPDANDVARAKAAGVDPGGDIFIHGTPVQVIGKDDWTAGCLAVSDREIEEIYAMVPDGTPIFIFP